MVIVFTIIWFKVMYKLVQVNFICDWLSKTKNGESVVRMED